MERAAAGTALFTADGKPVGQPDWIDAGNRREGYNFRRAAAAGRMAHHVDGTPENEALRAVELELMAHALGVLALPYDAAEASVTAAVLPVYGETSPAVALQAAGGWPTTFTAAELVRMNMPAPTWLVEGVLPQGVTLLAGKPKSGKSFMAQGIAFALAAGGRALGQVQVVQTDTLYLYLEGGLGGLKERMVRMSRSGMDVPQVLTFTTEWPRGHDGIDALARYFETHPQTRFVVIDTLFHFRMSTDGSSSFGEEYEITSGITKCCTHYGVSAIIVHHASKRSADGLDSVLDLISGTTGLVAGVDNGAVLANSSNGVVLAVVPREMEGVTLSVQLDETIGTWRLLGPAAANEASAQQKAILEIMSKSPEPLRAYEIEQIGGLTKDSARKQLQRMWTKSVPLVQKNGEKWSIAMPALGAADAGWPGGSAAFSVLAVVALGMVLGLAASWISVRRFIRQVDV